MNTDLPKPRGFWKTLLQKREPEKDEISERLEKAAVKASTAADSLVVVIDELLTTMEKRRGHDAQSGN